jgi:hypothetical protein
MHIGFREALSGAFLFLEQQDHTGQQAVLAGEPIERSGQRRVEPRESELGDLGDAAVTIGFTAEKENGDTSREFRQHRVVSRTANVVVTVVNMSPVHTHSGFFTVLPPNATDTGDATLDRYINASDGNNIRVRHENGQTTDINLTVDAVGPTITNITPAHDRIRELERAHRAR